MPQEYTPKPQASNTGRPLQLPSLSLFEELTGWAAVLRNHRCSLQAKPPCLTTTGRHLTIVLFMTYTPIQINAANAHECQAHTLNLQQTMWWRTCAQSPATEVLSLTRAQAFAVPHQTEANHLCNGWEHVIRGQDGGRLVRQVEPLQARQREQRRGHDALVQLAHPRLHVAPEVLALRAAVAHTRRQGRNQVVTVLCQAAEVSPCPRTLKRTQQGHFQWRKCFPAVLGMGSQHRKSWIVGDRAGPSR